MNGYEVNPFQELYVTDDAEPSVFVRLFSDFPVKHAQPLFREGNVILKGTQGSGKSMLLNLFRPRIRVAYQKVSETFPIPRELCGFIAGGINLRRSGALNIGQRKLVFDSHDAVEHFPLYFGDFVNYYVVRDVLNSINTIVSNSETFEGLVNPEKLDAFACEFSKDPCWVNGIHPCHSFSELCASLDERLQGYVRFHNYNGDLPQQVQQTKTSIGEPIAKAAEHLRQAGAVPPKTPLFIHIDQLESLHRSDTSIPSLGPLYRQVINKAIGMRDLRVSYRIGTRQYAWEDDLRIYGREDELENIRDYRVVDLDETLRRKEDAKTWIFPEFAEDAFNRRLVHAGHKVPMQEKMIGKVFGTGIEPPDAARQYCRNGNSDRILRLDATWPESWKDLLGKLFKDDPYEAALAAAWARQTGGVKGAKSRLDSSPPSDAPWRKAIWKKERVRQCLVQLASRSSQRLKWAGRDDVLALSSGNISIFLSICHDIWEAFLRSERKKQSEHSNPVLSGEPINPDVQAEGIRTASDVWYEKIAELPNGDDRQKFIDVLGQIFRDKLLNDLAMSYPGHNGFSIANEDLRKYPSLVRFLEDAVRHGDLHDAPHTTKEKNRRKRTKWYLSPILSPHYQIPESHAKEPYYVENVVEIAQWLARADIVRDDLQAFLSLANSVHIRDTRSLPSGTPEEQLPYMDSKR